MSELFDALTRHDRRLVESMASAAGVTPGAILPEIIAAYLRLLKDVPAVLPRDPMRGLSLKASQIGGAK